MDIVAPRGGTISVGPTAAAWDFTVRGGATGTITVGEFARNATIWPGQTPSGGVTVHASATNTFLGPFRRVGQSVRELFKFGPGQVVLTASLPAAADAMDGTILIEDGGAGDRNLIIYAGGQRFRIDGGANV